MFPTKKTSDDSISYNMSARVINSIGNTYKNVTSYGGLVIRNHKNIEMVKITNESMNANKTNNNNILSAIYLRDIISNIAIISNNSLIYDDERINQVLPAYSNFSKYTEENNSWNPSVSYNVAANAIPTNGIYKRGDRIIYTNPSPGGYIGVICVESGSPGTWREYGGIN